MESPKNIEHIDRNVLIKLTKKPYTYWTQEEFDLVDKFIRHELLWERTSYQKGFTPDGGAQYINPDTKYPVLIDNVLKRVAK